MFAAIALIPATAALSKIGRRFLQGLACACLGLLFATELAAASYEMIGVEAVYANPARVTAVLPYAIVIRSSRRRFENLTANTRNALARRLVYQTRVRIKGQIYYRLAVGNFASAAAAQAAQTQLRPFFKDAWVYHRSDAELSQLEQMLQPARSEPQPASVAPREEAAVDGNLLEAARQAFLDQRYDRVVVLTDRVLAAGEVEPGREALELAGAARERQGKFAEAAALYQALLGTEPDAETAARISGRLEGLRTMTEQPRERLPERDAAADARNWETRGAFQQYYRDDIIEANDNPAEKINQLIASDIDLQLRGNTRENTMLLDLEAGVIRDFVDERTDTRVSEASFGYVSNTLAVAAGRQNRAITGVNGRIDGLSISHFTRSAFQFNYAVGYIVQSSFDGVETDNPFAAASVDIRLGERLDLSLYTVRQEIFDLIDREAVGGEFQWRNERGYVYGIVDYDTFYRSVNNITFISSLRYDARWTLNLNVARSNTPPISTLNALQGQDVDSIEDLGDLFSEDEIYQLADDRTSPRDSINIGSIYTIDDRRQLYLDFSLARQAETEASGGVAEIPEAEEVLLAADYAVAGFFAPGDYTTLGLRFADTTAHETLSLRLRSRFQGYLDLIYDPRIRIDYRRGEDNRQTILAPSIRITYRATKQLSFEGDFRYEYSDLDLPDFDRQRAYSLYLGYAYFF